MNVTAKCHKCNWESLTYKTKAWALKAADKHQDLYHRNSCNIIEFSNEDRVRYIGGVA